MRIFSFDTLYFSYKLWYHSTAWLRLLEEEEKLLRRRRRRRRTARRARGSIARD
jgi:hypothetical protein